MRKLEQRERRGEMEGSKVYAVIDTNVLVSALMSKKSDSSTTKVLDALTASRIIPLYNHDIINEYYDVLFRAKFKIETYEAQSIIRFIRQNGISSERITSDEYFPDRDDIVFYEVALSREDSFLVTGNKKHFPKNPIIVSPAEMVEILGL